MATTAMMLLDAGNMVVTLATSLIPKPDVTRVNIVVGDSDMDDTLGGNAPYVSLFDNHGRLIGIHEPPKRSDVWGQGKTIEGGSGGIDIKHLKRFDTDPSASYILLSNCDNNAICIAHIGIADLAVSTNWAGDMGKYCGMYWYPSNLEIGPDRQTPKCVWLDGDNSNGLPQALSFQIEAFTPSADKITQYMEYKDTLCKSTPRFSTWQDLDWNSPIPYFSPPLKYEKDFTSQGQGADLNFSQIVDTDLCKYDEKKARKLKLDPSCDQKGVKKTVLGPTEKPLGITPPGTDWWRRSDNSDRPKLSARLAKQLVVSSRGSHSATEVCESETSFGPDFISTEEGMFCNMSQKKTFPICGREGSSTADACFDLETNTLVVSEFKDIEHTLQIREALPATHYSLVRRW